MADEPVTEPGRAAISEEEVSALLESREADRAQPFNLSTRRVNRMQLPMLEVLSKNFAERGAVSLSALISRGPTMQFESLRRASGAELQMALPTPASVAVVRFKPLPGQAYVNIEPDLLLTLLDGFFGGTGRHTTDPAAAAAPAAQRFFGLMLRGLAADWAAVWAPLSPVEMELVKQETNPRFVNFGDPAEALVVVKFSVQLGARIGHISWLLPETLLAPVREMLSSENGKPATRVQVSWAPVIGAALQDAEIRARVILAKAQVSLGELVRLAPGDIIPIDAPQQATLLAGDVPLYRGRFGISQGRNALKITLRGP
ncbi:MAG: flagellar motor switch protein FliM [Steroidobacterales bacterium]